LDNENGVPGSKKGEVDILGQGRAKAILVVRCGPKYEERRRMIDGSLVIRQHDGIIKG